VTNRLPIAAALVLVATLAADAGGLPPVVPGPLPGGEIQLPNGRLLTPTGAQTAVLPYPFALSVTPDGRRVVVASTGATNQALQLLDAADGRLVASVPVKKSWLGLALGPGGTTAFLSGANSNSVHLFTVSADRLAEAGSIPVTTPADGKRDPLPAGITVSADGATLWVARVLADDVVEDDAQNGSDHVDAHRTVALVVSPYTRRQGAVDSTLYSTTSMLRTMEMILGVPPLSQHDASATPMTNAFSDAPDGRPFLHRPSNVPLYEMNPDGAPMQAESGSWDLSREDAAPDIALNEAVWKSVRGAASEMPPPVNAAFVRPR
jgi:hypothetical protein